MKKLPDLTRLPEAQKSEVILELWAEMIEGRSKNQQLEELIKIHRLWIKHLGKLFPSDCGGKEIPGIDLVTLDSYTAGCISTFLEQGKLDSKRENILRRCKEDLGEASQSLQGYAGFYYRQLGKLASAVLTYIEKYRTEASSE
jgi:hypothetical protein